MTLVAGIFDSASLITIRLMHFISAAALSGCLFSPGLSAQETNLAEIILSNGDRGRIKVGAEHAEAGETRYPLKKSSIGKGAEIEFSLFPATSSVRGRSQPPRLSDLIGNPRAQAALNNSAKPGDWVTPPAATR